MYSEYTGSMVDILIRVFGLPEPVLNSPPRARRSSDREKPSSEFECSHDVRGAEAADATALCSFSEVRMMQNVAALAMLRCLTQGVHALSARTETQHRQTSTHARTLLFSFCEGWRSQTGLVASGRCSLLCLGPSAKATTCLVYQGLVSGI